MKTPNSLKNVLLAVLPATLMLSSNANADFQYHYLQASYVKVDVEFGIDAIDDTDSTGPSVEFSYPINENIAVGASYLSASADTSAVFEVGGRGNLKIDTTAYRIFGLYHLPLNEQSDYLLGGHYSKVESEGRGPNGPVPQLDVDEDSKSLFAGIRFQLNESIELQGLVDYDLDADDGEDEISFSISGLYSIAPTLSVGVSYEPDDSADSLAVNVRKYFF